MAVFVTPKDEEEIKGERVTDLRKDYKKLGDFVNKLGSGEVVKCCKCGEFKSTKNAFYTDDTYADGYFPVCKECLLAMAEQRTKPRQEPNETRESVKRTLRYMNLPYIDSLYTAMEKNIGDDAAMRKKHSIFSSMIVQLKSLPQWKGKTYDDSEFGVDDEESTYVEDTKKNQTLIKRGKKRFGNQYQPDDLLWLENEYEDWTSSYAVEQKSQAVLFQQLCCQELEANRLRQAGKATKDIDRSIQDTMAALGIKPSQSNLDALTDSKTFGELLDIWENDYDSGNPLPTLPDPELEDVDHVGKYITVFFTGHLAKMMGLKNTVSSIYDKFMKKFTVNKKEVNNEQEEELFNQIFGSDEVVKNESE